MPDPPAPPILRPVHGLACNQSVERFEPYGLPPRVGRCPRCGAKPRHRATLWYLREVVGPGLGPGSQVLEVGAAKFGLARHPGVFAPASYLTIDIRRLRHHGELAAAGRFALMDVARLGLLGASLDVILCNHALSFVPDYRGALAELGRCLAPDGLLMLEVPQYPGPTQSAQALREARPDLDDAWFPENGDRWAFGEDFDERVAATGLAPRIDELFAECSPASLAERGLKPRNRLRVVFRDPAGPARFPPPGPAVWPAGEPSARGSSQAG